MSHLIASVSLFFAGLAGVEKQSLGAPFGVAMVVEWISQSGSCYGQKIIEEK